MVDSTTSRHFNTILFFSDIGNGVGMKIWQCFSGLPQQSWFYTDDDRIAVTNHGKICFL